MLGVYTNMKCCSVNNLNNPKTQLSFKGGFLKKAMVILPLTLFSPSPTLETLGRDVFLQTERTLVKTKKELTAEILKDLNIIVETNFRGGKTTKFDSLSVEKLKNILKMDTLDRAESAPIKNAPNVYLCDFGMFGAKRPGGRPHMGLDVFVTPYSRKPKQPVLISSPIDGVVISSKKANDNDNLVSNSITIIGFDGKRYGFDHMARAKDYPKDKAVLLPQVGQIIKSGDSLGYVGSTGETSLWHLHLTVMSDEARAKQMADPKWVKLSEQSAYTTLRGQVDPLDEKEAGKIAKWLNQYAKR